MSLITKKIENISTHTKIQFEGVFSNFTSMLFKSTFLFSVYLKSRMILGKMVSEFYIPW